MSNKFNNFIHTLIPYDYALFGGVFLLFLLFVILGIALRKRAYLAIPLILIAFATLILGPTLGYVEMHNYLFSNSTTIVNQKKLTFTKAIVINGLVKNTSDINFKSCKITAKIYKSTKNEIVDFILGFKPIYKMSIIEDNIPVKSQRSVKMIIEPFTYTKNYALSLEADCK